MLSRRLFTLAALTILSGLLWLASWEASHSVLGFTALPSGTMLVYLPAGVRLAVLLVTGLFGAIGVALAFPVALFQLFSNVSPAETIAYSALAGFLPYAALLTTCRLTGISRDLKSLRPAHLPLLAGSVSVVTALGATIALAAFGRVAPGQGLAHFSAMAAGDFLGCFAVVLIVRLAIAGYRSITRRP